jgi:hypothetical protein
MLEAPGILQEKIPAAALWDRRVALDVSMRNLLIRAGYKTIDQIREEGIEQGIERGIEQGIERGIEQGQLALIVAGLEQKLQRALSESERARVRDELRAGRALMLLEWLSLSPEAIAERLAR